jgi:hypothetical protein
MVAIVKPDKEPKIWTSDQYHQIPRKVLAAVHAVLEDACARLNCGLDMLHYRVVQYPGKPPVIQIKRKDAPDDGMANVS